MLDKNSELYALIKKAVLEAMKDVDKKVEKGSYRLPKGNITLMKRLIKEGRRPYEIQQTFLDRFAFSGADKDFVIRYVDVCRELCSRKKRAS